MSGDIESKYWAELFRALAFVFATPAGFLLKDFCSGEIFDHEVLEILYSVLFSGVGVLISFWFVRRGAAIMKWEDKFGDLMRRDVEDV